MKALIKLMAVLFFIFALTFVLIKLTGVITIEKIELWLNIANSMDVSIVAAIIIALLFADLFIAMPTLTLMLLSGYFLGASYGAIVAILGVTSAGIAGYWLSYFWGDKLERLLIKKEPDRLAAREQFSQYGVLMIILSRAMPILPEISACLAGLTKMPFLTFFSAWLVSSIPYAVIATYAGSISTLDNPKPAIITAILLSATLWAAWYFTQKLPKFKKVNRS